MEIQRQQLPLVNQAGERAPRPRWNVSGVSDIMDEDMGEWLRRTLEYFIGNKGVFQIDGSLQLEFIPKDIRQNRPTKVAPQTNMAFLALQETEEEIDSSITTIHPAARRYQMAVL